MIPSERLTESEIIDRILNGEKALYEIIVKRYNPYLYKVGRSYNYNHEDTQDLMQDTFVDAYKNLKQFEGRASFKSWITRIMLNNCFHKKEKFSFKNETSLDINENSKPIYFNVNNDISKIVQNNELGRVVENALTTIPEDYRVVFSLREINGFNVAETSELLDISESNVKARLSRAKTMLRSVIEQSYSKEELFDFNAIYCNAMVDKVMKLINKL